MLEWLKKRLGKDSAKAREYCSGIVGS